MSKHFLFLLHGMGDQKSGWSTDSKEFIEDKASEYTGRSTSQLRTKVEIVELEYGSLLSNIMKNLLENGGSLGPANDWLKGNGEATGLARFVRDSALDVAAYIWHSDTSIFVLNQIAEKLLEVIQPNPLTNKFSILCHSLGTKVGFDLLHTLYIEEGHSNGDAKNLDELSPLFKLRPRWEAQGLSPKITNFYLVANVMPLLNAADLQTFWSGDSHVRILRTTDPYQGGVIVKSYRIFNNHYDPFSRVGRTQHVPANVYSDHVVLAQAHEWNMHSLDNYLAHPAVHIPIIQDVYDITVQNRGAIVKEYLETHRDPVKEAALDTALMLTEDFDGVDPKGLMKYLKTLADLLPTG